MLNVDGSQRREPGSLANDVFRLPNPVLKKIRIMISVDEWWKKKEEEEDEEKDVEEELKKKKKKFIVNTIHVFD